MIETRDHLFRLQCLYQNEKNELIHVSMMKVIRLANSIDPLTIPLSYVKTIEMVNY